MNDDPRIAPSGAHLRIDLNADLGEWDSLPDAEAAGRHAALDEALMDSVSSVNVACGGHVGDAGSMRVTVRAAARRGLAVGAHPSLPDRQGFGRGNVAIDGAALERVVADQIALFAEIAAGEGVSLAHVKPHGTLYHRSGVDPTVAGCVAAAVAAVDRRLLVVGRSGGALLAAARRVGLAAASEVFCDRAYGPEGDLVPRGDDGAILADPHGAAESLLTMLREGRVVVRGGGMARVVADTGCIHGDTPGAAGFARRLRAALERAGVTVECPWKR